MKFEYNITCLGAGYVGGPTMAIIAKYCPNIKVIGEMTTRIGKINPIRKLSDGLGFRFIFMIIA